MEISDSQQDKCFTIRLISSMISGFFFSFGFHVALRVEWQLIRPML